MKHELGSVIARRAYFDVGDMNRTSIVEVEIAAPVKSPHADHEFMCSFRIKSPGSEVTETVYGIDELQALQLALGYVEAKLRRLNTLSGLSLRWAGDEEGDLGIRIPTFST